MLLYVEIFVNTLVWLSRVLGLVGFHLSNEVDKMLWLFEELELFCVDEVTEFILNLNDKFDNVKGIKPVVAEVAIEGNRGLLGGSKVVSEHAQDVLLDLVIALKDKGVVLLSLDVFPERDLVAGLELSWH